jgi:hypothetical protein
MTTPETVFRRRDHSIRAVLRGPSLGGNFLLRAAFPVTADTAGIIYFQAVFTTSAGTATTVRTPLQ